MKEKKRRTREGIRKGVREGRDKWTHERRKEGKDKWMNEWRGERKERITENTMERNRII